MKGPCTAIEPSDDGPVRSLVLAADPARREELRQTALRAGESAAAATESEAAQLLAFGEFEVLIADGSHGDEAICLAIDVAHSLFPWLRVIVLAGSEWQDQAFENHALQILPHTASPEMLLCEIFRAAELAQSRARISAGAIPNTACAALHAFRRAMESAFDERGAELAFDHFFEGLATSLPAALAAGIWWGAEESALHLKALQNVSAPFLDAFAARLSRRATAFFGRAADRISGPANFDNGSNESRARSLAGPTDLVAPLFRGRELAGLLAVTSAQPFTFSASDAITLRHAANYLAIAKFARVRLLDATGRDPLTGLLNRTGLKEATRRLWLLAKRHGWSIGAVMIDIDGFKQINDQYGHAAGDDALRELAALMTQTARRSDILARLGGDELVAILPHASTQDALAFARRLQRSVHEFVFGRERSNSIHLSLSIGVASSGDVPEDNAPPEALLERSDQALYAAKAAGPGSIRSHSVDSQPNTADGRKGCARREQRPKRA